MRCPSLFLKVLFVIVFTLSDICIAIAAFLCLLFSLNVFFHSFFLQTLSLYLKCVSYRQHIVKNCFFMQSDHFCLLIEEFNPFILDVIFYIFEFNSIILIFDSHLFPLYFDSLIPFLPYFLLK